MRGPGKIRGREWLVVLGLLAACGLLFWLLFPKREGLRALVMVEGETVYTLSLEQVAGEQVLPLDTEPKTWVKVDAEGICFVNSQCPDKICMGYGVLHRAGETAVCLPARAIIRVVDDTGADAVVG